MGPIWDMYHHMIGWKSKVMDKVIKEIQGSQWECDKWLDEDIPLDLRPNNSVGKKEGRKKKKKREDLDLPRVVCEYGDLFLNELPGLPPWRDVDFCIELHPDTSPPPPKGERPKSTRG